MMHHELKMAEAVLGLCSHAGTSIPKFPCIVHAMLTRMAVAVVFFLTKKIASLFYLRDFLAFLILCLKIFEECALVMATIHGHILAIFMPSIHGIPWNPKGSAYPLEEPFVIASEDEVMAGAMIVDTVEL